MKNTLTVDAHAFLAMPIIDTSLRLEVCEIRKEQFRAVKSRLIKLYGESVAAENGTALAKLEYAADVAVPPQTDFSKARYNAADALRVIARLTQEDGGCPWDRVQTHESIRINMIEEAYEAVDAIDKHDIANMREEFGDVFLQSILQSDIARRGGEFDFDDVCDELCKKLIGRHTFIFGADSAANADEALGLWEKAKAVEKNYDSVKTQLSKLPENFPALLYAQKTYKKMKKGGIAPNPQAELDGALENKDYVRAIDACSALLAESGKDAEVELNKRIKQKIHSL